MHLWAVRSILSWCCFLCCLVLFFKNLQSYLFRGIAFITWKRKEVQVFSCLQLCVPSTRGLAVVVLSPGLSWSEFVAEGWSTSCKLIGSVGVPRSHLIGLDFGQSSPGWSVWWSWWDKHSMRGVRCNTGTPSFPHPHPRPCSCETHGFHIHTPLPKPHNQLNRVN